MTTREIVASLNSIRDHIPHAKPETTAKVIGSLIEMIEAGEGPRKPQCRFTACQADAAWLLDNSEGDPYTHACSAHLGIMLNDAPEHTIRPIE